MSTMTDHRIIATELNSVIQNYLYEKLGDGAEFNVQYNSDNIHVWVKVPEKLRLLRSMEKQNDTNSVTKITSNP